MTTPFDQRLAEAAEADVVFTGDEHKFDYRHQFVLGAHWTLSSPEVLAMRDALAEIIRNSHDIMAKKCASRALAAFDKVTLLESNVED